MAKIIEMRDHIFDPQARRVAPPEQQKIVDLAYRFWLERDFRNGSPLEDWLRAWREVRRRECGAAPSRSVMAGAQLISGQSRVVTIQRTDITRSLHRKLQDAKAAYQSAKEEYRWLMAMGSDASGPSARAGILVMREATRIHQHAWREYSRALGAFADCVAGNAGVCQLL